MDKITVAQGAPERREWAVSAQKVWKCRQTLERQTDVFGAPGGMMMLPRRRSVDDDPSGVIHEL